MVCKEMQDAVTIIRSLINSKKSCSTIRGVISEYREMTGELIPFKNWGYSNVDDFLIGSDEFRIDYKWGEVIQKQCLISYKDSKPRTRFISQKVVLTKNIGKDAHIVSLVQTTNTKKPNKVIFI